MGEEGDDDWTLESGLKSGISNFYTQEEWDTDDDSDEGDGDGHGGKNGASPGEGDREISNKGSDWDTGDDTGLGTTTSGEDDEESEDDEDDDDDDDDEEEDWSSGDDDDEESSEDVSIDDDDTDFKPSFHGDSYHFTTLKPESAPLNGSTSNILVAKEQGVQVEQDPLFNDEFLETLDGEKNKKPGSTASIESEEEEVLALIKRLACFMVCLIIIGIAIALPVLLIENNKDDDPKATDMPSVAPTIQLTKNTTSPSFNPTTTPYPSTSPPTLYPTPLPFVATSIVLRYDIIVPNGKETNSTSMSHSEDLIEAMNRLAGNVLTTLNIGGSGSSGDGGGNNSTTSTNNDGGSLEQQTNGTDVSVGGSFEQTDTNTTARRLLRRLRQRQRRRFLQEVQLQLPTIIINIMPLGKSSEISFYWTWFEGMRLSSSVSQLLQRFCLLTHTLLTMVKLYC